jgi:hypothetical protein
MKFKEVVEGSLRSKECVKEIEREIGNVISVWNAYGEIPYDFSVNIALPLARCFIERTKQSEELLFKKTIAFFRARIRPTFFLDKGEKGYELLDIGTTGIFGSILKDRDLTGIFNSLRKFDRFNSFIPKGTKPISFYLLIGVYTLYFPDELYTKVGKELELKLNERWNGTPFKLLNEYPISPGKEVKTSTPFFFKFLLYKTEEV